MQYKDILVFLDNGDSNAPRVETAIALAAAHDARLVGIAYDIDVPRHIASLIPGFSVEQQREASRLVSQSLVDQFTERTKDAGITAESTIMKCRGSRAASKLAALFQAIGAPQSCPNTIASPSPSASITAAASPANSVNA